MDDSLNRVFDTGSAIIGKISDTEYRCPRIDRSTHTLQTIEYEHHEAHSGKHYYQKGWADVASAATVLNILIQTPDSSAEQHVRAIMAASDEFRVELYEDATASATSGSVLYIRNNNRRSSNTTTVTMRLGVTVSNFGTQIWDGKVGSTRAAGVTDSSNMEIIFKRNSQYIVKVTKVNAGTHWFAWDIFFYEHTPKG